MQRDIWLGNPKLHCDFEDTNTCTKSPSSWTAISLAIQSREKARRDWWIGNHTVKSGSTLQNVTALSGGEAEFYAVVKGDQVALSLRSIYMDLGMAMKVGKQSDSSTANSLTDRLGARPRTKHTDTQYFWVQERVQDGDFRNKKVSTAKKLCRCWNEACLCFSTTTTLQVCRIGLPLTRDPSFHYRMMGDLLNRADLGGTEQKTETDTCHNWL